MFVCKACGELGKSGGMHPWEILILDLLLDAIWWNLGLFCASIYCVIKALYLIYMGKRKVDLIGTVGVYRF